MVLMMGSGGVASCKAESQIFLLLVSEPAAAWLGSEGVQVAEQM